MRIGVPTEIKPMEGRVALVPAAVGELTKQGHQVFVQRDAGVKSGYPDMDYDAVGAKLVPSAGEVYAKAQILVKVKEPISEEYGLLREDHILFSFLHLAAAPELAAVLQQRGLTAVAFETITEQGRLPLLAPMSDIAGRIAAQVGITLLHTPQGGRGVLLGGLPAADRGKVVIIGAGIAGGNAAGVLARLGVELKVFSVTRDSLSQMHELGPNVTALPSYTELIQKELYDADLLIGAVLIPGAKAPHIVSTEMVRTMRPGSVIIDISVDQGGCIETIHPTDYSKPTYEAEGVIHFGVTNMPGAVPRTATQALSAAIMPYLLRLAADNGLADPVFELGINVRDGKITHPAVAEALAQT